MATYRYEGDDDLEYDNANDDYSLIIVPGDEYTIYPHGSVFVVNHSGDDKIDFRLTKREGNALIKQSRQLLDIEPDPSNPPYLLFEPKFELVEKLYAYYNKSLFNGKCPPVKFRKSRNSKVWGMAKLEYAGNNIKKPVFTFYINESAMVDRVLFTNTIVHEMIHLYLFKSGTDKYSSDPEQAMREINASHGPLFLNEMHRINAKGFHIITEGTHEELKRDATEEFYAIVAERGVGGGYLHWTAWYTHRELNTDDLDIVVAKLQTQFPHESMHVRLITTKNREITFGTNLKASKNFPPASLDKQIKGAAPLQNATVLEDRYLRPVTKVRVPAPKDMPDVYALPFNKFIIKMKKYTEDQETLRGLWKATPLRLVNAEISERLKTLAGRVRRKAISEQDLLNLLMDIKGAYDERFSHDDYVNLVKTVLNKHDGQGELVPYYRIMRLDH